MPEHAANGPGQGRSGSVGISHYWQGMARRSMHRSADGQQSPGGAVCNLGGALYQRELWGSNYPHQGTSHGGPKRFCRELETWRGRPAVRRWGPTLTAASAAGWDPSLVRRGIGAAQNPPPPVFLVAVAAWPMVPPISVWRVLGQAAAAGRSSCSRQAASSWASEAPGGRASGITR